MDAFTLKILDDLLIRICHLFAAAIIAYPYPKTSLKVLKAGGMPKPHYISLKTSRRGLYAGHLCVPKDKEDTVPKGFSLGGTSKQFGLLKDKEGNYITSDLDLLAVISDRINHETTFLDAAYGYTTKTEKEIILEINRRLQPYGIKQIITHGSCRQFIKPTNIKTLAWPLLLYTPKKKFVLKDFSALYSACLARDISLSSLNLQA